MAKINSQIFKEYDIRGFYPTEINEAVAHQLGAAFGLLPKVKKVVVGYDRRPESTKLLPHLINGLASRGVVVYNLGVTSTAALSFASGLKNFDGAIMLTASHNPLGYAGLKLINRLGVPIGLKTGLKKIAQLASRIKINEKIKIKSRSLNIFNDYYKLISREVDFKTIKGFKVILDASGGSGNELITDVFEKLPVKNIKINFRPGDQYPDHGPNPLLVESQVVVEREIIKQKADLGLVWDGDADRVVFFDEKGGLVEPNYVNCLLSQILLEKKRIKDIVVDARLPMGVSEIIKKNGGRAMVSRAGTANVIELMQKKKNLFGCENSGHYFFNFLYSQRSTKNYVYSDAVIVALLVIEYLAKNKLKMSEAVDGFRKSFLISGEINFKVADWKKIMKKLENNYQDYKKSKIDGLSVFGPGWFFNIRPSHTEPLVRLNIEARDEKMIGKLKKELTGMIKDI